MSLGDSTPDLINTYALRFDGWAYAQYRGDEHVLATLSDRFVGTLQTSTDPNENHAAFFALQRFLCKWGGEHLPDSSRERWAFRFLFLHLYGADIEPGLRSSEYWERWHTRYAERAEVCAAEVRESLLLNRHGSRRRS